MSARVHDVEPGGHHADHARRPRRARPRARRRRCRSRVRSPRSRRRGRAWRRARGRRRARSGSRRACRPPRPAGGRAPPGTSPSASSTSGSVRELLVDRVARAARRRRHGVPRAHERRATCGRSRAAACHACAPTTDGPGARRAGAPSHSTAGANPRSRPASAPTGPPPRSTQRAQPPVGHVGQRRQRRRRHLDRDRAWVGVGPAHGTSPRMTARRLEVVGGDARRCRRGRRACARRVGSGWRRDR